MFGRATFTVAGRLDVTAGGRIDYENKNAAIHTFYAPAIAPAAAVNAERSFSKVSPQLSAAYHLQPAITVYGTAGRGFKAGGFNPASPAGSEAGTVTTSVVMTWPMLSRSRGSTAYS